MNKNNQEVIRSTMYCDSVKRVVPLHTLNIPLAESLDRSKVKKSGKVGLVGSRVYRSQHRPPTRIATRETFEFRGIPIQITNLNFLFNTGCFILNLLVRETLNKVPYLEFFVFAKQSTSQQTWLLPYC